MAAAEIKVEVLETVPKDVVRQREGVNELLSMIGDRLNIRYKKWDEISNYSRQITWESKRCISQTLGYFQNKFALKNAERSLRNILSSDKLFLGMAKALYGEDPYMYSRAYSPCLQEFIEAFSILTFFSEGRLITYDDLTQLLSWSWDSPSLQNGNDQPQPANYKLLVSQSDFVMGLADIPGELVRACGIGARTSDFKMFLFKSCKFLQQFFRSFSCIYMEPNLRVYNTYKTKRNVMRGSVNKLEYACYETAMGGRLTTLDFASPKMFARNDDGDSGVE